MTSDEADELRALVRELVEEIDPERAGEIGDATSLVQSGLLDSLALLQIAEWIFGVLGQELDLNAVEIREEWDTIDDILAFVERRR